MIFITSEDELILHNKYCLYFYSKWMPFNKKMASMLKNIQEKYKDISIYAIDVDEFKSSCKRFKINSVPQILFFKEGIEKERIEGICISSALKSAFLKVFN